MQALTKKDFTSAQEVRWCPGCGDYNILSAVQKAMPDIGVAREDIVFISGIGCSSRFPYYMNTFGFHSIHGRAPTLASGVKLANPNLSVWVITGDGDGLSIGGNHLIHALRRNMDINVILFNNRIYGLTKGQYSPTSELGKKTKSSPDGTVEAPIHPVRLALASEATFVARAFDTDLKLIDRVIKEAAQHKGSSFVEIYQNCNIFNDGAFKDITDKKVRSEKLIYLEDGQPLLFGEEKDKGIVLEDLQPKVVDLKTNPEAKKDVITHRLGLNTPTLAALLASMHHPDFPTPVGVFFQDKGRVTYEERLGAQIASAQSARGKGDLAKLFRRGTTWTAD